VLWEEKKICKAGCRKTEKAGRAERHSLPTPITVCI